MPNSRVTTYDPPYQFVGTQQVYTPTTSTAVTLPAGANGWLLQAAAQNIHIRFDGNAATTNDFVLVANDPPVKLIAPNAHYFFYCIQAASGGKLIAQPIAEQY